MTGLIITSGTCGQGVRYVIGCRLLNFVKK